MTVLTVTLNAAIDKRYDVAAVEVGHVQRVGRVLASAGGKGLNAARGAQLCGQRVVATGFVAGFAGQFITSQVAALGMQEEFVRVAGESRTCINIIDADGRSTEFLEPGVTVTASDLDVLQARFEALLPGVDVVTMSGSVPSGCPEDVYVPLITAAERAKKPVILDTSGALLRAGLAAGPTIVKPNRDELSALVGRRLSNLSDVLSAARSLVIPTDPPAGREVRRAPVWVVVSLGADGALAVSAERTVRVEGLTVPAVNPVGCGDVLVGGLAAGLASGLDVAESLSGAVRVSAAAAAHPETGRFDPVFAASLHPFVSQDEQPPPQIEQPHPPDEQPNRLVEQPNRLVEQPNRLVEPVETTTHPPLLGNPPLVEQPPPQIEQPHRLVEPVETTTQPPLLGNPPLVEQPNRLVEPVETTGEH